VKTVTTYLTGLLKALVIFLSPIKYIVLLVALSTIIDTLFGLWRAYQKGVKIESKKLRYGFVPKLITYCVAVVITYATDFYILNDLTHTVVAVDFLSTKLLALVLISIEVKSMDESFEAVKGYSFISKIINLLQRAKNVKKELAE
jgi:peptidoglycan biosynthesis protein MviN/MurJ (putative lipid II flippase)